VQLKVSIQLILKSWAWYADRYK